MDGRIVGVVSSIVKSDISMALERPCGVDGWTLVVKLSKHREFVESVLAHKPFQTWSFDDAVKDFLFDSIMLNHYTIIYSH